MSTDSVSTAKCTSVRRLNSKIGSRGDRGRCWYCRLRILDRLARERVLQLSRDDGMPFRLRVTSSDFS